MVQTLKPKSEWLSVIWIPSVKEKFEPIEEEKQDLLYMKGIPVWIRDKSSMQTTPLRTFIKNLFFEQKYKEKTLLYTTDPAIY